MFILIKIMMDAWNATSDIDAQFFFISQLLASYV